MKTQSILILGLGNDILTDDAAGLHVVREIQRRLETLRSAALQARETQSSCIPGSLTDCYGPSNTSLPAAAGSIEARESVEMGLSLLDEIIGFDDLVLVDAVQTRQAPPGFLHEIELGDLKILPGMSPHFLGIGEILALGRELGLSVPQRVRIFAIEVEDPFTVSTEMTHALCRALPQIIDQVMAAAQDFAHDRYGEIGRGERGISAAAGARTVLSAS